MSSKVNTRSTIDGRATTVAEQIAYERAYRATYGPISTVDRMEIAAEAVRALRRKEDSA
jgi:hypothetical protein